MAILLDDKMRLVTRPISFLFVRSSHGAQRGLYAEQLENWLSYFPRSSLLILTSDVLYKSPSVATDQVLAFMGLAKGFSFDFKAPKNAACDKEMAPFFDANEISMMKEFYATHNKKLPDIAGFTFPWLSS